MHLHFLADDRDCGGHSTTWTLRGSTVQLCEATRLTVDLPMAT